MTTNDRIVGATDRRSLLKTAAAIGVGAGAIGAASSAAADEKATVAIRMSRSYFFKTPSMDYFMLTAAGWGLKGGLDIGQIYYIAAKITDDDPESWVKAFSEQGDMLVEQADSWKKRGGSGWIKSAGETRLKAFSCYRFAWQYATPGEKFDSLYAKHQVAFAEAMKELKLPAKFFKVPYGGKSLPGVFFPSADKNAPVAIMVGGGDTCFEDLYFSCGRGWYDRGYSVALVDLPGQGNTWVDGLHFEAETEKPLGAIIDLLIKDFGAKPGRMALLGTSLGGYFAIRAAAYEPRLATSMASTPLNGRLIPAIQAKIGRKQVVEETGSKAEARNSAVLLLKAGVASNEENQIKFGTFSVDPSIVTMPFLSILGTGEGMAMAMMTHDWHDNIRSTQKRLVILDKPTGADSHCQVGDRHRLVQETVGWMDEIFKRA